MVGCRCRPVPSRFRATGSSTFDFIKTYRNLGNEGLGDFPMEYLTAHSWLPTDDSSKVKFTLQSKNELNSHSESVLFKDSRSVPV